MVLPPVVRIFKRRAGFQHPIQVRYATVFSDLSVNQDDRKHRPRDDTEGSERHIHGACRPLVVRHSSCDDLTIIFGCAVTVGKSAKPAARAARRYFVRHLRGWASCAGLLRCGCLQGWQPVSKLAALQEPAALVSIALGLFLWRANDPSINENIGSQPWRWDVFLAIPGAPLGRPFHRSFLPACLILRFW